MCPKSLAKPRFRVWQRFLESPRFAESIGYPEVVPVFAGHRRADSKSGPHHRPEPRGRPTEDRSPVASPPEPHAGRTRSIPRWRPRRIGPSAWAAPASPSRRLRPAFVVAPPIAGTGSRGRPFFSTDPACACKAFVEANRKNPRPRSSTESPAKRGTCPSGAAWATRRSSRAKASARSGIDRSTEGPGGFGALRDRGNPFPKGPGSRSYTT